MSFNTINALRKQGDVDAAYAMAKQELTAAPDDIWLKRALAWVLNDKIKQVNDMLLWLAEVVRLDLDTQTESMFFDNLVWSVSKNIAAQKVYSRYIDDVFNMLKSFCFHPSKGYSYLFKVFHKYHKEWAAYLDFCEWWGLHNFLPEDFRKFKREQGGEIMSLVEQAYIGYAKSLLARNDTDGRIRAFIPQLKELMANHEEYQYPPYFLAKLYQKVGDKAAAMNVLLPFVCKKTNNYWVWQILGDVSPESDMRFSCYSKALSCRCKPEMLVAIKESYARMLFERRMFDEAKTELIQVVDIRKAHAWRVPLAVTKILGEAWFAKARLRKNNIDCYNRYKDAAEEILLTDCKVVRIMIVAVNPTKKTVEFMTTERRRGWFFYDKFLETCPDIGSIYKTRFADFTDGKPCKVLTIVPDKDIAVWSSLTTDFKGKIIIDKDGRFGFVKDKAKLFFVPKTLLNGISPNVIVSGRAVVSYDKKRQKDGWTAFKIIQNR